MFPEYTNPWLGHRSLCPSFCKGLALHGLLPGALNTQSSTCSSHHSCSQRYQHRMCSSTTEHRKQAARQVVQSASLEIFKTQLDRAVDRLILSPAFNSKLGHMIFRAVFPARLFSLFHTVTILNFMMHDSSFKKITPRKLPYYLALFNSTYIPQKSVFHSFE